MKTAEEYATELFGHEDEGVVELVKAAQIEAFNAGLEVAAKVARSRKGEGHSPSWNGACEDVADEIDELRKP